MKLFPILFGAISVSLSGQTPAAQPPAPPSSSGGMTSVTVPVEKIPADLATVPKDKVLVQVNNTKITAGDLDLILKAYPENTRIFILGPGKQQFFDQLVRTLVLSEEGKRRKLDAEPVYRAQAEYSLAAILANTVNEDLKKKLVVDDAALAKFYEAHKSESEKLKARHILVRMKGSPVPVQPGQPDLTEEQALAKAQQLRARLVGGADFAELAKTESDDTLTGAKGGALDVFGHGQMVPSFEEAAYKLKNGEISEPVKSPFGFHIIQVEKRQVKTLEELRPELETKIRPELVKKQVDELVNKAKVILAPEILPASKMAPAK